MIGGGRRTRPVTSVKRPHLPARGSLRIHLSLPPRVDHNNSMLACLTTALRYVYTAPDVRDCLLLRNARLYMEK